MNKQPIPDLDKLGLDPEVVQALKPRLTLTFGAELDVSYTTLQSTGNYLRCSLEQGEEVALRTALDELKLDPGQEPPLVECWLPLRDVRLSRGMAGDPASNGMVDDQLVEHCAAKARTAAADVSPGWAGTRLWGDIAEIAIDGVTLPKPVLDAPMPGDNLRVEVLEAFYHPEVEAARTNMLKSCGLPTPAFLHLTCTSRAEAFTTQHERQEGIAVLWLDPSGAEITISHGGHVVALTDFPAPHADPTPQLFEASAWLQREGWSPKRLPHGIRLLGRGLERAWLDAIRAKIPLTVTLPDEPEIDRSLALDLLRNSMLGSRQLR